MKKFLALSLSDVVFIMLNNCWHFNIYEQDKFMLSCVEHRKSFITSGPGGKASFNDIEPVYLNYEFMILSEHS